MRLPSLASLFLLIGFSIGAISPTHIDGKEYFQEMGIKEPKIPTMMAFSADPRDPLTVPNRAQKVRLTASFEDLSSDGAVGFQTGYLALSFVMGMFLVLVIATMCILYSNYIQNSINLKFGSRRPKIQPHIDEVYKRLAASNWKNTGYIDVS
eukprot:GHVO01050396.1.p1 GENE.GHVO01050396.1~~GHVO01050396.1.p1  ORF type:complete len:152 (+),score=12.49 GHVO01050396.1:308-763(+)